MDVHSRCPLSFSELISAPFGGLGGGLGGAKGGAPSCEAGRCPPRADGDLLMQPHDPRYPPRSCPAHPPRASRRLRSAEGESFFDLRVQPLGLTCHACRSAILSPNHTRSMHRSRKLDVGLREGGGVLSSSAGFSHVGSMHQGGFSQGV